MVTSLFKTKRHVGDLFFRRDFWLVPPWPEERSSRSWEETPRSPMVSNRRYPNILIAWFRGWIPGSLWFLHIFAISQHFCYQKWEVPTRMQTSKTSELPACASSLRPGGSEGGDTKRVELLSLRLCMSWPISSLPSSQSQRRQTVSLQQLVWGKWNLRCFGWIETLAKQVVRMKDWCSEKLADLGHPNEWSFCNFDLGRPSLQNWAKPRGP